MKQLIIILCLGASACCSSRKGNANIPATNDSMVVPGNHAIFYTDAPECIKDMVRNYTAEPKQNPPRKIYQYQYKAETVYYVTAICCDMYSDLYDSKCNLIAHPDGGITGKGDGKLVDFNKEKKGEKLMWEDKR